MTQTGPLSNGTFLLYTTINQHEELYAYLVKRILTWIEEGALLIDVDDKLRDLFTETLGDCLNEPYSSLMTARLSHINWTHVVNRLLIESGNGARIKYVSPGITLSDVPSEKVYNYSNYETSSMALHLSNEYNMYHTMQRMTAQVVEQWKDETRQGMHKELARRIYEFFEPGLAGERRAITKSVGETSEDILVELYISLLSLGFSLVVWDELADEWITDYHENHPEESEEAEEE